jgi:hypothetical protein
MELTEHRPNCTVQQPITVLTGSVQWKVQWTLCGAGAIDGMVAVHNNNNIFGCVLIDCLLLQYGTD